MNYEMIPYSMRAGTTLTLHPWATICRPLPDRAQVVFIIYRSRCSHVIFLDDYTPDISVCLYLLPARQPRETYNKDERRYINIHAFYIYKNLIMGYVAGAKGNCEK
jgi:hypothetical protein